MIRHLRCRECGPLVLAADDRADGWKQRAVVIAVTSQDKVCDGCGCALASLIVWAVTQWRGPAHPEPRIWEDEYGTILPLKAMHLADKLSGYRTPISTPRCLRLGGSRVPGIKVR